MFRVVVLLAISAAGCESNEPLKLKYDQWGQASSAQNYGNPPAVQHQPPPKPPVLIDRDGNPTT